MGKALIFDGNSILNRAFFGVKGNMTAPDGLPTNALFGFVSMIRKAFSQVGGVSHAAIAFDLPAKTFRHQAVASYKANRTGMPEELALQLPLAKNIAKALGLTVIELEGFEADDVLGTLSKNFSDSDINTFIVTGDRDSYQLINDKVTVLLAATGDTKIMTPAEIKELYGVEPRKMIDIKALMGDSSDNISGVRGVGEKTAIKLINDYGSLDGVYDHADEIKGKLGENIREGKDDAYTSRFLAEIKLDAPLGKDISDLEYKGDDSLALREIFTRLGFRQFLEKLDDTAPEAAEEEEFLDISELPENITEIYLHVSDNVISAACGDKLYKGDAESVIKKLANAEKIICWSSKELLHLFAKNNLEYKNQPEDISLLAYVCSPADNGVSFGGAVLSNLGVSSQGVRASLLKPLYEKLMEKLDDGLKKLYSDIELPLAKVLCDMEETGFYVDRKALDSFGEALAREIADEEAAIYEYAGGEFNINSPKQLGKVLFENLSLPAIKKNKNGYSTDAEVLEKLEPYHPIISLILDYRKNAKLKNTYCDGLAKQIEADGRIHTTFKQTQTLTGRLSSAEPNLQNIPVRSDKGRELRKFFSAKENHVLIDADYSQVELRVLAHVSGDETLINAFKNGEDIHTVTASQVFGVDPAFVNSEMRKRAKAVNFGIIYGIGAYSLSQDIHVTMREAQNYIENYLARYPKVKDYLESQKAFARENGFVNTMFGRRRYIPEISSKNANLRAFGERVAMNTPIQGTAADIIKAAMIKTEKALLENKLNAKLILQIHDELILEAPESEAEKAKEILCACMESAADMKVKLAVDVGIGKSWFDAKD